MSRRRCNLLGKAWAGTFVGFPAGKSYSGHMKISRWVNFVWNLSVEKLPVLSTPKHFRLGVAEGEDHQQLRNVIEKSFTLDPSWNPTLHMVGALVRNSVDRTINAEAGVWLALRHGTRVIGGTLITVDPGAVNNSFPARVF